MTGRIRWEEEPPGYAAVVDGFIASAAWAWRAFIIYHAIDGPGYSLVSALPGQADRDLPGDDIGQLKAAAERWLEEFVSSLGAVFPDAAERAPVHYQWPVVCGDLSSGDLWTGNLDRVTCAACRSSSLAAKEPGDPEQRNSFPPDPPSCSWAEFERDNPGLHRAASGVPREVREEEGP